MKATLEKLLADAKPERNAGTNEYSNFNELFDWYGNQYGATMENYSQYLGKYSARSVPDLIGRWETIPHLIGMVHRLANDGYEPFKLLGLTADEERQFQIICVKIREAIGNGGTAQRTTQTRQLYDQVKRLGI